METQTVFVGSGVLALVLLILLARFRGGKDWERMAFGLGIAGTYLKVVGIVVLFLYIATVVKCVAEGGL